MAPEDDRSSRSGPGSKPIRERICWEAFEYYPRLQRVRLHLEENIGDPLNVARAAELAALTPNYFCSYFRSKVGVSFTDWMHVTRVEFAKRALNHADFPIRQVVRMVGFRDLRTFERAFKRHVGVTPSEYKKRVRPERRSRSTRTENLPPDP